MNKDILTGIAICIALGALFYMIRKMYVMFLGFVYTKGVAEGFQKAMGIAHTQFGSIVEDQNKIIEALQKENLRLKKLIDDDGQSWKGK